MRAFHFHAPAGYDPFGCLEIKFLPVGTLQLNRTHKDIGHDPQGIENAYFALVAVNVPRRCPIFTGSVMVA